MPSWPLTCTAYGLAGTSPLPERSSARRLWWLTGETSILRYTRDLVERHGDRRYIMRPDFLLNFFALSPSMDQVRRTYRTVFPSLLGLRLSKRMDEEAFCDLMKKVTEAGELEPSRRLSAISSYSDRLKSDFRRQYATSMESSHG